MISFCCDSVNSEMLLDQVTLAGCAGTNRIIFTTGCLTHTHNWSRIVHTTDGMMFTTDRITHTHNWWRSVRPTGEILIHNWSILVLRTIEKCKQLIDRYTLNLTVDNRTINAENWLNNLRNWSRSVNVKPAQLVMVSWSSNISKLAEWRSKNL